MILLSSLKRMHFHPPRLQMLVFPPQAVPERVSRTTKTAFHFFDALAFVSFVLTRVQR